MVLIEAEGPRVTRVNYGITSFNNIDQVASGGAAVEISNFNNPVGEPGVLTFTWTAQDGPAGKYDIRIAYFDEEDGESPLTFSVNGEVVGTYVYNLNLLANRPEPTAEPRNYVPLSGGNSSGTLSAEANPNAIFKDIDLEPGDQIEISVLADTNNENDNFERGRLDVIEITRIPSVDLFWHNPVNGQVALWTLNGQGTSVETTAFITDQSGQDVLVPENAGFEARGVIDLGDGIRNPLWRDTLTGGVAVWNMERSEFQDAIITQAPAGQPGSDLSWEIRGTGDVNGGGAEEIFWYNTSSGEIAVWEINETGFQNATFIKDSNNQNMIISPNDPWQLVAAGDMDGDGDADAIWENMDTQEFAYWKLDGTVYQEPVLIDARPADGPWEFRGAYDANRDGIDDFFFRNSQGQNGLWIIENNSVSEENILPITPSVSDMDFSFYV
ncbi:MULTISPECIES: FG-GAP-like repeat-containing protein [unclassified Moorena]|uniref:FG-GAP-like repeat-containing protein n=1 Tax=unclassified Moorena TaxID=2683338 RepID=UPI001400430A|nr:MULTISPECIES: FG-GAP-like repeat-containing protein [unclassified Moorena]NEO12195.1 hypothetical protein [Moorena sp. SIO3E8]NEP97715.1 hypothetical protein [Moorena sp. SIO3F7]